MTFRYRLTYSPTNIDNEPGLNQLVGNSQRNYFQWQLKYQAFTWLLISNKVYYLKKSMIGHSSQKGYFICQDLQFRPERSECAVSLRYALFDTDSYDTRMYAYENDVPNAFSVPALSGKGSRCYLMVKFRILNQAECWIRYSRTFYSDVTQISDGPAAISGNSKSDIHVMMKIKF
jgi:hypothetical protein